MPEPKTWYCKHCGKGPMSTTIDTHCCHCSKKRSVRHTSGTSKSIVGTQAQPALSLLHMVNTMQFDSENYDLPAPPSSHDISSAHGFNAVTNRIYLEDFMSSQSLNEGFTPQTLGSKKEYWTCCACKYGPQLLANNPRCSNCLRHEVCSYCQQR